METPMTVTWYSVNVANADRSDSTCLIHPGVSALG